MENWNRILNILTIVAGAAVVFVVAILYLFYVPVDKNSNTIIEFNVENGNSLAVVAEKLDQAGLLRSKFIFVGYVQLFDKETEIKAGRYVFSKAFNIPMLVSYLIGGKSESDDFSITIQEGLNVWEIDEKLVHLGIIGEGEFSSQFVSEEGYLFPDTYRLEKLKINVEEDFIQELRSKMAENFQIKMAELFKNLNMEKQKEIIIIASILEKEAKTEEDMKLVAGIIYKRLELDMPLQIDATMIYGACLRNFQFSISDLQKIKNCDVTFQGSAIEIPIDGQYNTYMHKGLPPGPISNPGLKAIGATLNPTPSDYLYYLSTRDGDQIIYSKTSSEHAANRKKYLGI